MSADGTATSSPIPATATTRLRYVKLMADLPQLTPLGTILSYNNAAFSVAGRVIEVVTGKTYEAALKELVLDPIGLKHSFMFRTDVMTHSFAVGHTTIADKAVVLRPWQLTRACGPAGGIAASMIDQLRYARFHLGDGTAADGARILTRESLAMMQTLGDAGMLDIKMGLAWMTRDIGGLRRVFHGGGTYGQLTAFTMTPARRSDPRPSVGAPLEHGELGVLVDVHFHRAGAGADDATRD